MGFWTSLVGTVVGGIVGGPIGAGIGAGLGALVGMYDDESQTKPNVLPELPLFLEWVDDLDGRRLFLRPNFQKNNITKIFILAFDKEAGELIKGQELYADSEGRFFVSIDWSNESEYLSVYIPDGVIKITHTKNINLRILFGGESGLVGKSDFNVEWPTKPYSRTRVLRPIVGLAMRVARADGRLDRAEVAQLRHFLIEQFSLSNEEQSELKDLMKLESSTPINVQIDSIKIRMPWLDLGILVELILGIVNADNEVYSAEVDVVRDILIGLGLSEEMWPGFAVEFKLISLEERLRSAYAELGLPPDSNMQAVKDAYRSKMKDYHPDKVATMPIEFRQLAEAKSKDINAAYDFIVSKM